MSGPTVTAFCWSELWGGQAGPSSYVSGWLCCVLVGQKISSEANGRESRVTMSGGKRVKSSIRNKLKSFFYAGWRTKYKIRRPFEEKPPDEPSCRIANSWKASWFWSSVMSTLYYHARSKLLTGVIKWITQCWTWAGLPQISGVLWESSCPQLSDQLLRENITPGATWFRKPS